MPTDNHTHYLQIKPQFAKLLCGIKIIAYYPMSHTAMSDEVGTDHYKVTTGNKGVTCPKCKERMKDE